MATLYLTEQNSIVRKTSDRLIVEKDHEVLLETAGVPLAMLIVVSYDVPNDRRRGRLSHALKDFGERVQYSVFECRLDVKCLDHLGRRIAQLIDPEEDRLRIYLLCADCDRKVEIHGQGKVLEDPDVYIL